MVTKSDSLEPVHVIKKIVWKIQSVVNTEEEYKFYS